MTAGCTAADQAVGTVVQGTEARTANKAAAVKTVGTTAAKIT